MKISLECKKIKRSGILPAFIGSGILAAAVPILNMTFRSALYTGVASTPVSILLNANWQMMAMLNVLLVIAGACLMYHLEYESNALQRMRALPIKENSLFFGKLILLTLMGMIMLAIETAALIFCVVHWFCVPTGFAAEILKNFCYSFLLILPAVFLSLLTASACRNMWVALGIGVICVFTATMLPTDNFALSLFPYAMPFQIFDAAMESTARNFIIADVIELFLIAAAEMIFLKVRRLSV